MLSKFMCILGCYTGCFSEPMLCLMSSTLVEGENKVSIKVQFTDAIQATRKESVSEIWNMYLSMQERLLMCKCHRNVSLICWHGIAFNKSCNMYFQTARVTASFLLHRWIYSYDGSFPFEEEDWLLRYPDLPSLHHDRHSLPSVFLVKQRVSASQDCVW